MAQDKPDKKKSGTALEEAQRNAAWKYVGYPGFSRFMASSTDCFAVRKFCHLNVRVLLKIQNDIVKLERELMEMDLHSMNMATGKGGCGSFRLDADTPRERHLDKIAVKTKDYNERLNQFLQLQDRPTSSLDQITNLRNWLSNYPNAIEEDEQQFIHREEDLVVVRTAQRTQFGRWMEWIGLSRIARPSGLVTGGPIKYYDRGIWKSIGAVCMLLIMLVMLLGPMWSLPFVVASPKRLALVTAFALAFGVFVVIGTTLKGFQRLILIASYFVQLILVFGFVPAWDAGRAATEIVVTPYGFHTLSTNANTNGARSTSTAVPFGTPTANLSTSASTIISTVTITPTPTAEMPSATNNTYHHSSIHARAITGIVVGICAAIMLVVSLLWLLWRRRRRTKLLGRSSAHELEIGKIGSLKRSGAVRSSTKSSGPPAKIREKWIGVGCTRQEAMDSQILELPEPTSCLELEGRISPVRQSSNVDPASVERRTTLPSYNAAGLNHHGEEHGRDSPVRESAESEERTHLVSSSSRSTGKAHRKLGTLRIDTSQSDHIFDEKG